MVVSYLVCLLMYIAKIVPKQLFIKRKIKKVMKKIVTETELRSIISNVINESEDVKQYIKEKQKQNILNSVKVDIHNLRTGIDSLLSSDFDLDDELRNYLLRIKKVL